LFPAAYIGTGQILGWGSKAIEIRSAETGHLDGVFMHVKDQKLKFLCERNYKVGSLLCLQCSVIYINRNGNESTCWLEVVIPHQKQMEM